jgi:hypothetical protein
MNACCSSGRPPPVADGGTPKYDATRSQGVHVNKALMMWLLLAVLLGVLGGWVGINLHQSAGMRVVMECIDRSHIPDMPPTPA